MKDNYDFSQLKKPKKVNSKKKGNKFENDVCKILNEHFGVKDFCRTPGSGAYATTHYIPDYLKIYGDLITPEGFAFVIDTKKGYNDLDLFSIFNDKSSLWGFIEQSERDSIAAKRPFLLIYKQDRRETLVIVRAEHLNKSERHLIFSNDLGILYGLQEFKGFLKKPKELFFFNKL